MGMVKAEFVEYEGRMEEMKATLEWMTKYGVKTFKDSSGEMREIRCSRLGNFFDETFEVYPHLTE